jgi:hypothetical protein
MATDFVLVCLSHRAVRRLHHHGPACKACSGEPDIAVMALHLASSRSKNLSGCVFEAETH